MKYLGIILMIIFPYAYLFRIVPALINLNQDFDIMKSCVMPALIFIPLTFIFTTISSVNAAKGDMSAHTAAKLNLLVKGIHIPAYIFHFIMGLVGTFMSVWGLGIIIFVIVMDLMTITLSGTFAVGCNAKICKEGLFTKKNAVIASICSFIYCADVAAALVMYVSCLRNKKLKV